MTMILQDSRRCTATVKVPSPTQITAQGRWRRWNSQHISSQLYYSSKKLTIPTSPCHQHPPEPGVQRKRGKWLWHWQHHWSDYTSTTPNGSAQSVTITRQRMNRRLRMTTWMTDLCFAKVEARCRHCHPVMMTGILRFGWIARRCTLRSDVPLDLGPSNPQLSCRYLQDPIT